MLCCGANTPHPKSRDLIGCTYVTHVTAACQSGSLPSAGSWGRQDCWGRERGRSRGAHWLWPLLAWHLYTSLLCFLQPSSKDHALGFNRIVHTALEDTDGSRWWVRETLMTIRAEMMVIEYLISHQRPRLFAVGWWPLPGMRFLLFPEIMRIALLLWAHSLPPAPTRLPT